jgi:hypothetical protein
MKIKTSLIRNQRGCAYCREISFECKLIPFINPFSNEKESVSFCLNPVSYKEIFYLVQLKNTNLKDLFYESHSK